MAKYFKKEFFEKMSRAGLCKWFRDNSQRLIGSAIATKSGMNLSKLICKLSKKKKYSKWFYPLSYRVNSYRKWDVIFI